MARTSPKPFVFVLMPFDAEFDDVYKLGIQPACEEAGAYCERVDEQIFQESILERIFNQISKADIIVSDMTGRNPNVFYEVGYAHALGKAVLLLTRSSDDIPFDLKHFPHVVYGGSIVDLKESLATRVRYLVEHPGESSAIATNPLEYFVRGTALEQSSTLRLRLPVAPTGSSRFRFAVDVHNASERAFDASRVELAVVLPASLAGNTRHAVSLIPGGRCAHLLGSPGRLLPDAWKPFVVEIPLSGDERAELVGTHSCALRVFSEIGASDISFSLSIVPEEEEQT